MPHPWIRIHTSWMQCWTGKPTLSKVATRYTYSVSLSLNCTEHSAVKRKTSYHSKVTRVSQMQLIIYNIHYWISMLIHSVQICTRGTALRMARFCQLWYQCATNTTTPMVLGNQLSEFLSGSPSPPGGTSADYLSSTCTSMAAFVIQNKPHNRGQLAPTSGEQFIEDSDLMNPDTSISNEQ